MVHSPDPRRRLEDLFAIIQHEEKTEVDEVGEDSEGDWVDEDEDEDAEDVVGESVGDGSSSQESPRSSYSSSSEESLVSSQDSLSESEDESDCEASERDSLGNDSANWERFHGAAKTYGKGPNTFARIVDVDDYAELRKKNRFYPFSCKKEWEISSWLLMEDLPMGSVADYLKLDMVCSKFFVVRVGFLADDTEGQERPTTSLIHQRTRTSFSYRDIALSSGVEIPGDTYRRRHDY